MDEQILREILDELKGIRRGQEETNRRLDTTVQRLESLERTTNERFAETNARLESLERTTNERFAETNARLESLERTTNERFTETNARLESLERRLESLEHRFDGLHASVQVLTQGFSDVRYELQEIKKLLSTRVIWTNDNVSIQVREGETIYGIIRKEEKKE